MKIIALIRRRLVLGLWPLLLGAFVAGASGKWWGLGEAVALYSWWVPAMLLTRMTVTRRRQFRAFLYFAFVFLGYAMSTVFFGIVAGIPFHVLTRWPVGEVCVPLSLVLGVGLVLAMWPAQRRFYAEQRARAAAGA
ncbi:hypothetical protein [Kitasatospora viridis]|uniref:hypothetical protein n=1 Tax=Kitasatospora viridis TaxID=281105 RepID=UPI0011A71B07|nr:hypothetical protein [Kitasatospora viridis]